MASATTPLLGDDFFEKVGHIPTTSDKVRWYMCVIVNLSAMNYPDLIPVVWRHLSDTLFPHMSHDERFHAARKIREGLIKSCGIVGAAKTGTSMRELAKHISSELDDPASLRSQEDPQKAAERGRAFHKRIYGRNPEFDPNATVKACADYAYVVRDILYGRIFSFDAILNDLETGQVIVSALIGIDCQHQLRNHMKGMLYNGATREELTELRDLCLDLARRLGVVFRNELQARPIPQIEDGVS